MSIFKVGILPSSASTQLNSTQTTELGTTQLNLFSLLSYEIVCVRNLPDFISLHLFHRMSAILERQFGLHTDTLSLFVGEGIF